MVGNYLQRNIGFSFSAIFYSRYFRCIFNDRENQIRFKIRRFALQHGSQTFETGTGINIFVSQRRISTIFILIILSEYQIPDFQETVTIAAYSTSQFAAAAFFTQIDMNLGAGTAGAAADLPKILFQPYDAFFRQSNDIMPDIKSFIIFGMDSNPQLISRNTQLFGNKFPAPRNDLFFKIIAEREITKHFKISMVAGSTADILNIACTHAFLAGRNTRRRRFHFTCKKRFERSHTGANQKQRRIILRNE